MHSMAYQHKIEQRYRLHDAIDNRDRAEDALARLHSLIGEERYQDWCDVVLTDDDNWLEIERKARNAVDELGWDADYADLMQTQNDTRACL